MEIVVSRETPVQLQAPDAFDRFSVVVGSGVGPDLQQALEGIARIEGGTHAWVFPQAVRRLAARATDKAWNDGFDAMLAFAADRGWLASDGAIRAHIDVREG
ncbi:hypothetical protein [Aquibium sp. ELW1220]|uniref:hypothetical protein n=1 Tax=Aquibium sp. ELW1220 TaxID=2976766 RepID=UPI0025AF76C7|nr:hypothetical protein [Aquibium sp. ELW1220]MDN2581202.1 hypothetical protein [Aquibium sp. ELW1220]